VAANTFISVQKSGVENFSVVVNFNPQDFNLKWQQGDVIRVVFKKSYSFIKLVKVSKRHKKQLAFTLSSTDAKSPNLQYSLSIPYTKRRFTMNPSCAYQMKTCAFPLNKKSVIIPIPL